jgi:hypothetical protein
MADQGGRDPVGEWRRLAESLAAAAAAAAGNTTIPKDLLRVSQRQVELLQEVIQRERGRQGELAGMVTAPIDALFDLMEETGATLRLQAEALASAGRALEETAALMSRQAERFERTVGAIRQPAEIAKAAAGAKRKPKAKPKPDPGAKPRPKK